MGWQVRLHLLSQWSRGSGNIEGLAPELVKEHKCGSLFPVFKTKHELHSLAQRSGEVRFQEEVETKVVEPAGEGPNNVPTSLDLPRSAPLIVNHRWAGAGNDGSYSLGLQCRGLHEVQLCPGPGEQAISTDRTSQRQKRGGVCLNRLMKIAEDEISDN
jgi:hypothetical protein